MKQPLTDENIRDIVNYRIERAIETLKECDDLIEDKHYNTAVNRLYYACYYAVTALLAKHRITATTHACVKQMLGLNFVRTGLLDTDSAHFYSTLFNDRITGDYDDFVIYSEKTVLEIRPQAEDFVNTIQKLLK